MVGILNKPTFVCKPDDDLATVDAYKFNSGEVVNSIRDVLRQVDPTLSRSLSGMNSLDVSSITKSLLNNNSVKGLSYTQSNLLNRIISTSPSLAGVMKNMDSSISNIFKSALGNNVGGIASIGGAISNVKFTDMFASKDISNMLSNVTGSAGMYIKDAGAQLGMMSGLVKSSLGSDISGVTKEVFGVISDRTTLTMLANEIAPSVVRSGKLYDFTTLADNLSSGSLLRALPSALKLFTTNYSDYGYGYGYNALTYSGIISAFNSAAPGWNSYQRVTDAGIENTINIAAMVGANSNFNAAISNGVLSNGSDAEKAYLLGALVRDTDVGSQLSAQYPGVVLSSDTIVKTVTDPRTLTRM